MATESKKNTGLIRLVVLILIVVAVFVLCLIRLMNYQVVKGDDFAKAAQTTTETYETIKASRGEITDRYGRPLVTNKLALNLELDKSGFPGKTKEENPRINEVIYNLTNILREAGEEWIDTFPITASAPYEFLPDSDSDIAKLKKALNVQEYATADDCLQGLIELCGIEGYSEEETRTIAGIRAQMLVGEWGSSNPYLFAEDVSGDTSTKLMELGEYMPGVRVSESYVREYVSGNVAPHLIGSMSKIFAEEYADYKEKGYKMNDTIGRDGIEAVMENDLRGTDGKMVVVKNKDGEIVEQYMQEEPKPGNTVMLTIDANFQKEVQDILENRVLALRTTKDYGATKGAAAAVLDVKTGEALALASYPTYEINDKSTKYSELRDDPLKPLTNRVLNETYRPGSTFKTVMTIAGVDEGIINPSRLINCTRIMQYRGSEFQCQQFGHSGNVNIYTALEHSCNIYFYTVGDELGIDKIDEYAQAMGLGVSTGLELRNEMGQVSSPEISKKYNMTWVPGDTLQTSIGQSETYVTPLQMAISTMTIANKGVRYESHLVKSVEKYDYSGTVKATEPVVAATIEDKSGAFDIDTEGMKRMAETISALKGKNIAAKSGTPQVTKESYNSAAVAFYPADNPEIAIAVMIERGSQAADTIGDIVDAYNRTKTQEDALPQNKEVLIVQ